MDCTENRVKYCHLSDEEKAMFPIDRKKDGLYCILKDNGETDFCSHDTGFNPRSIYRLNLVDGEWYYVVHETTNREFIFKYKSGSCKTSASVIYDIDMNCFQDWSCVCTDFVIRELCPAPLKEIQKVEALINHAPKLPDWVVFEKGFSGLEFRFNNGKNCLNTTAEPFRVTIPEPECIINNSTLTLTKTDDIKDGSWYWDDKRECVYLKVNYGFVSPNNFNCGVAFCAENNINKSNLWEITHNG